MDHSGPERDLSSGEDIEQHESTLLDPALEPSAAIPAAAVADVAQPRGVWVTTGMFGSDWQQQQRQSSEPRVPLLGNHPVTTGHSPSPAPLSRAELDETVPQSRPEDSSSAGSRLVGAASNSRPDTQQHRTDSSTSEPDPLGDVSATGTREGTREDTDTDAKRKPPHIGSHAVAEQRKQRRLAKNREAAAVSRERKRVELTRLQQRVQALEHENAGLSYTLTLRENELGKAREELASLRRGARGDSQTVHAPASAAPGVIALPSACTFRLPLIPPVLPSLDFSSSGNPACSFAYQATSPLRVLCVLFLTCFLATTAHGSSSPSALLPTKAAKAAAVATVFNPFRPTSHTPPTRIRLVIKGSSNFVLWTLESPRLQPFPWTVGQSCRPQQARPL